MVDVLCASQLMVNVVECFVLASQLVNVVDVLCASSYIVYSCVLAVS